jgi:hypothetical protein
MAAEKLRAAILVIFAAVGFASTQFSGIAARADTHNISELWEAPEDVAARDLFHGPGGPELAPEAHSTFTWVATDKTGYSPGFDVRGTDGREWSVKLGPEAQTEVVASRILWAIGYHQPPTYYVKSWHLSGGPGGEQGGARFRSEMNGAEVVSDWSWTANEFAHTQPFRGLIVANILLSNWDWKTSNNKVYLHEDARTALSFAILARRSERPRRRSCSG